MKINLAANFHQLEDKEEERVRNVEENFLGRVIEKAFEIWTCKGLVAELVFLAFGFEIELAIIKK